MGSQFVDLNADGHLDYLSATFDGSPHWARGSAEGFATPEHLMDAEGRRLIISSIWNYESKRHMDESYALTGDLTNGERCISALAFDWDEDGDYDLLLGSYENGHLYLQMNTGTKTAPKFSGKLIPVMAGDRPFELKAKMTAPVLIDWDRDGDLDIVAGSFGDSYSAEGEGGGVYLSLNRGRRGAPDFGPLRALIAPSSGLTTEPSRPNAGLYPAVLDYDGDGDLDLIVGGYSFWKPEAPKLSETEQEKLKQLEAQFAVLREKITAIVKERSKAIANIDPKLSNDPEARVAALDAVFERFEGELTPLTDRQNEVASEIGALRPGNQRKSFVWLYERVTAP